MNLIMCLDDQNGMFFNHRRQSRDRVLTEDIIKLVGSETLWMAPYSLSIFPENTECVIVADDDFLKKAKEADYCFVEESDPAEYLPEAEKVIIYRWNRKYPHDVSFTGDLSGMKLTDCREFAGYSHESITREIYEK